MASLRSDGKAVEVVVTEDVLKDAPGYFDGFHGIVLESADSGETVAMEIALREHEITVAGGVTAAKGDVLYIHADQTVDDVSGSGKAFMKVTVAKDSNNVVWGVLLPQTTPL